MSNDLFVHNMRLLRLERRLSAQQLSFLLNFSLNRVTDLENSHKTKITIEEMKAVADYFEVSVEDITLKKATITFK